MLRLGSGDISSKEEFRPIEKPETEALVEDTSSPAKRMEAMKKHLEELASRVGDGTKAITPPDEIPERAGEPSEPDMPLLDEETDIFQEHPDIPVVDHPPIPVPDQKKLPSMGEIPDISRRRSDLPMQDSIPDTPQGRLAAMHGLLEKLAAKIQEGNSPSETNDSSSEGDDAGENNYPPNSGVRINGEYYRTDDNGSPVKSTSDLRSGSDAQQKPEFEKASFIPRSNGNWSGEAGNSTWIPDPEYIPPEKSRNPENPYSNPENLTWGEILEKYGIEGIEYRGGYPVFDEIARGTVEIDDFTDDRDSNFAQANEKMAEQRGCSPEEVEKWMDENNYTWHECQDCKTMQKVPNEVHANVTHPGGVSVYKSEHSSV